MGQRHQAFLIAKFPRSYKGHTSYEYQCVAAIHHQWCYATAPARAARRFLDLAKVPTNAELIRFELRHFDENEGIRGRHSPSPYLLYILTLAFSSDLQLGYASSTLFESATMDSFGGGMFRTTMPKALLITCCDGITIFDVTDPSNCTYCHVISEIEGPISSEQYMRSYFDDDFDEPDDLPALLESMQQAPLISFKTLAEAWPYEYKRHYKRKHGSDPADVSRDDSLTDPNGGVPRLTDLIIHPALLRCIADGDLSAIEPFLWMPNKKPAITRVLQELDPFPDLALPLLDGILEFGPTTSLTFLSSP